MTEAPAVMAAAEVMAVEKEEATGAETVTVRAGVARAVAVKVAGAVAAIPAL